MGFYYVKTGDFFVSDPRGDESSALYIFFNQITVRPICTDPAIYESLSYSESKIWKISCS